LPGFCRSPGIRRFLAVLAVATLAIWPLGAQATDFLANARLALQKGDLKAAQLQLLNAVKSDPQNAEIRFLLARVELDLGDPVAAEREVRSAQERGYDAHKTLALLSQAMLAQQKFQAMLDEFKTTGKDNQLASEILVARGIAEAGLSHVDEAEKDFTESEKLAPTSVQPLLADARLAVARRQVDRALQKADAALAIQPKSADAMLVKAQALRMKGDLVGSTAVLDQAVEAAPDSLQAKLDRASMLLATGKVTSAQSDVQAVLAISPGNVQAIYLQAVLQANSKDWQGTDASLGRISNFLARIPRAYYLLAVAKRELGQLEQARDAATRYLARAPNDIAGYKLLAQIQTDQHQPDHVIETLSKIAETGRGDADTFDLLGRAYVATGRPDDAVKMFQKAETLAPKDVGLQTRLAAARLGQGDITDAIEDLEGSLKLAPTQPLVGEALFFATLATGDLDKASAVIKQLRDLQGETPVVENLDGLLLLARLDLPAARSRFEEVSTKFPNFQPAKANLARVLALQGHTAEAEKLLGTVLDATPGSEPALSLMVNMLSQANRVPEALARVERARAAAPTDMRLVAGLAELYVRQQQPQKALDLTTDAKGANTDTTILAVRVAALVALQRQAQARDTLQQILKIDPASVPARRQLMTLYMQTGDYESARNLVKEGFAARPRDYQFYQDYVMVDLKASGVDAALASARRLADQDRGFAQAAALPGDIYLAADRPAAGVKAYTEAFAAAPSGFLVIRLATAMARNNQPDEGWQKLVDWVGAHPDDLGVLQALTELDINTRRFDAAAQHLKLLLAKKPHDAVALNNLAWVYQQQGNPEAKGLAMQAYILLPGIQTADTLGWILTQTGDASKGLPLLRQASSTSPTDYKVRYHYAVALNKTGNIDEAVRQLGQVIAAKGEFREKTDAQALLDELKKKL
jgi:putative PEP-CTERM system TPR-repeat lipoprotein